MRDRTLKEELQYLCKWELISVVVFWVFFFYIYFVQTASNKNTCMLSFLYPLCIFSIILIQGSAYWLNCLRRCEKKKALGLNIIAPVYRFFGISNFLMIITYIPIFIIHRNDKIIVIIIGVLVYCFAILEQVNYYHFRLSYYRQSGDGLQIFATIKSIVRGDIQKSRISKDLLRYSK